MLKNMMLVGAGLGVGMTLSKYSKDIKKIMMQGKKEMCDMMEDASQTLKGNY